VRPNCIKVENLPLSAVYDSKEVPNEQAYDFSFA
jgi:hypothetical protein